MGQTVRRHRKRAWHKACAAVHAVHPRLLTLCTRDSPAFRPAFRPVPMECVALAGATAAPRGHPETARAVREGLLVAPPARELHAERARAAARNHLREGEDW